MNSATHERTATIGAGDNAKVIQPGKRWKVFQVVGEVDYLKIRSLKIKNCDCDCNEECEPQDDGSCSPAEDIEPTDVRM